MPSCLFSWWFKVLPNWQSTFTATGCNCNSRAWEAAARVLQVWGVPPTLYSKFQDCLYHSVRLCFPAGKISSLHPYKTIVVVLRKIRVYDLCNIRGGLGVSKSTWNFAQGEIGVNSTLLYTGWRAGKGGYSLPVLTSFTLTFQGSILSS